MRKLFNLFNNCHTVFFLLLICPTILLFSNCGDSSPRVSNNAPSEKNTNKTSVSNKDLQETKASFLAVGDIMLSRGVNQMIIRDNNPLLPFSRLTDLFGSTDFNFGNLESPISGNDNILGRGLVFNAQTRNITGLVKYNFKILNLANNHALDQRLSGLLNTREYLTQRGISTVGVGENLTEAWQPQTIVANGIKIGFIGASYASYNDNGKTRNDYVARIEDIEYLKAAVTKLKTESDFIVVTMHAGIEYTLKPHSPQIDFARAAIDAGADLIIGAHPHWIQTFEEYRGKYIFYSLGNFIFDQRQPGTTEGLTLRVTLVRRPAKESAEFETHLEQIELIPVIIERLGIPRLADQTEKQKILNRIEAKTPIIKFE